MSRPLLCHSALEHTHPCTLCSATQSSAIGTGQEQSAVPVPECTCTHWGAAAAAAPHEVLALPEFPTTALLADVV